MSTLPDGEYTAVVDRIEGSRATLELDGEGGRHELVVDRDSLPPEAQHQDAVLTVRVENDALVEMTYDDRETRERAEDAQDRFDRLSSRPPEEDTERD